MTVAPLALIHAPNIGVPHAFSTRTGGLSAGAYAGLNLDDREDDPAAVAHNREQLAHALGFRAAQVARLTQVHGTDVLTVTEPGHWTGDALVTRAAGVLLAIGTADCYPIVLADEQAGVVGAAHAGWKGTLGHIAARTVRAMTALGAQPGRIHAAVGPGICGEHYAVGQDVANQFKEAGLGQFVLEGRALEGGEQPYLDLAGANRAALQRAGVSDIWVSGRCSTEADFYSFRRDGGQTGRMWAVIGLRGGQA